MNGINDINFIHAIFYALQNGYKINKSFTIINIPSVASFLAQRMCHVPDNPSLRKGVSIYLILLTHHT